MGELHDDNLLLVNLAELTPLDVPIGRGSRGVVSLGGTARIIAPLTCAADLNQLPAMLDSLPVDLVEWRVDLYEPFATAPTAEERLAALRQGVSLVIGRSPVPVLATIRTQDEGGEVSLSGEEYAALVGELSAQADAVDIQMDAPARSETTQALIQKTRKNGAVAIASHHNFELTPTLEELLERYHSMARCGADVLKIACRVHSATDTRTILQAAQYAREEFMRPVIAIGMGEAGTLTRVGGAAVGCAATFAVLGQASAPGQLPVREVRVALDHYEAALRG